MCNPHWLIYGMRKEWEIGSSFHIFINSIACYPKGECYATIQPHISSVTMLKQTTPIQNTLSKERMNTEHSGCTEFFSHSVVFIFSTYLNAHQRFKSLAYLRLSPCWNLFRICSHSLTHLQEANIERETSHTNTSRKKRENYHQIQNQLETIDAFSSCTCMCTSPLRAHIYFAST